VGVVVVIALVAYGPAYSPTNNSGDDNHAEDDEDGDPLLRPVPRHRPVLVQPATFLVVPQPGFGLVVVRGRREGRIARFVLCRCITLRVLEQIDVVECLTGRGRS
jgi:hypothetical protein